MWYIWLILAGVFLIGEVMTTGFLIFWLSIGSLIAMIVSFFTDSIIIQTSVFVISSVILIFATKPFVKKFAKVETVLTNANSVKKIGSFGDEVGLSQIMIAIDPSKMNMQEITDRLVSEITEDVKSSIPEKEGGVVYYPGEIEWNTRNDNLKNGIPVIAEVWNKIRSL